ncbi:MAG: hypothetical protein ACP5PW_08035 [Candidatus Dormibacteria bacterium]
MAGSLSDLRELDAAASEARSVLRRLERLHGRLQGAPSPDLLRQAEALLDGGQQLLALLESERAEARARLRGLLRDGPD